MTLTASPRVSGVKTSGTPDGSIRTCLVAILERDDVPAPPADHPEPLTVWRNWLGILGLGLVPIREPRAFSWPGPWVAVLADGRAAVAFGAPPGLAWAPPGARFEDVAEGYVIAPADVALWAPPRAGHGRRRAGSRRWCSRPTPKGRRTSSRRPSPAPAAACRATATSTGAGPSRTRTPAATT